MKNPIYSLILMSFFFSCQPNNSTEKEDMDNEKVNSEFLNIPPSESGLQQTLNQYYSELNELVGQRAGQPLLLNNTITSLEIDSEAPFYTEGVFRKFADRKFDNSPYEFKFGNSFQTDRYSDSYDRIIDIAAAKIDAKLSSEQKREIRAYTAEIGRVRRELVAFETAINKDWKVIVADENLEEDTTEYELRRFNFLETIGYADNIKVFNDEIQTYIGAIDAIRVQAYTPSQQRLLRAKKYLSETYLISRPHRPYIERTRDIDEFTLLDPKFRNKQLFDVSPEIYPSMDLVTFKTRGDNIRKIEVSSTTNHDELHTRTWSRGGGASFSSFRISLGGSASSSGSSSYRKAFSKLTKFEMEFKDMEEVYVDRGKWFDPSIFNNPDIKPILDELNIQGLEYVSVSLILARGLTLKMKFDETLEEEYWKREHFRKRGGVKVLGYSFGGGGSRSTYDYELKLDGDKKGVTFKDNEDICRLIAVRLEKVYDGTEPEDKLYFMNEGADDFNKLKKGEMPYKDYQSNKIYGTSEDR